MNPHGMVLVNYIEKRNIFGEIVAKLSDQTSTHDQEKNYFRYENAPAHTFLLKFTKLFAVPDPKEIAW